MHVDRRGKISPGRLRSGLFALMALVAFAMPARADTRPTAANAHVCVQYPADALDQDKTGDTVLALQIGIDGVPRAMQVKTSSGDARLDNATLACVAQWRYKPATQSGTLAEVAWIAVVQWRILTMAEDEKPQPLGFVHHNCDAVIPTDQSKANIAHPAIAYFQITAAGDVAGPQIIESSGDAAFDEAVRQCVSSWRYEPPKHNGKPVAINWTTGVMWAVDHPVVMEVVIGRPHHCDYVPDEDPNAQGSVLLDFTIGTDGYAHRISISKPSGNRYLDNLARQCVGLWRYKPATGDGKPVATPWSGRITWSDGRVYVEEIDKPHTP